METSWKIKLKSKIIELKMSPTDYERAKNNWLGYFQNHKEFAAERVVDVQLLKKSLDARKKEIVFNLRFEINPEKSADRLTDTLKKPRVWKGKVHIVGFGPAGIFAAIECIRQGLQPIVFERGKAVKDRRRDVAELNRNGIMNPESNYCFGEGGAGTFSDGKLYTRSHKRGKIAEVLQLLIEHGAHENIAYEAHPHIGTNKLPGIIENLRESILEAGGEVHFEHKLTDIVIVDDKLTSIEVNGRLLECEHLILATGHSARDIYELLYARNVELEAKPFAMGFRIEHPQSLVNAIQYHGSKYMEVLPPASYSIVEQVKSKGVFSFCMCPGGIIAPAATADGEVVTNGWSPSKRNGQYANSGWVTEVDAEAWKDHQAAGPLAGLRFQQEIERKAYDLAGGGFKVPAQNLTDFLAQRKSKEIYPCSYHPGVTSVELNSLYPEELSFRLREGLRAACKKLKGFDHEKAVVVGPESRTSAPVRIPRGEDLQHPGVQGLYPCGEGAGYAGGILSAAMDGIRLVKAIASEIGQN